MPFRRPTGSVFRRRLPGLGPGGKPRLSAGWFVRIRRGGREHRRYGGPDRATALEMLRKLQREVEREILLGESPSSDITFAAFVPTFLSHAEREWTAESYKTVKVLVPNRLVPFFGGLRLRDITKLHVERFLATQTKVSGATRNRLLSTLSSIFRRAMDLKIVGHNPAREVGRSSEPQTPLPMVSLADQRRLVDSLSGLRRLWILMALETGLRLGELLRLEWRDLDLSTGTLQVRESKAKRPRLIVMSARLQQEVRLAEANRVRPLRGPDAVLRGARLPGGLLNKHWRTAFKTAARAIGHPSLRVHDLRHLAAINLVRAGLDLPTVQAVLGHRSLLSTLRYAAFADESAASRAARVLNSINRDADGFRGRPYDGR